MKQKEVIITIAIGIGIILGIMFINYKFTGFAVKEYGTGAYGEGRYKTSAIENIINTYGGGNAPTQKKKINQTSEENQTIDNETEKEETPSNVNNIDTLITSPKKIFITYKGLLSLIIISLILTISWIIFMIIRKRETNRVRPLTQKYNLMQVKKPGHRKLY